MSKHGKGQGNYGEGNPSGQEERNGGTGGRMKDMGFGEEDSKSVGPAKEATKPISDKCNTPDGQSTR